MRLSEENQAGERDRTEPAPPSSSLVRAMRIYARLVGLFAILAGAAALAGWWLPFHPFATVFHWRPMVPNTALMSIVAGIVLLLVSTPSQKRSIAALAKLLSTFICVVAGLTLAEYLWGKDLGIDQLFTYTYTADAPAPHSRLRPAPQTAASFVALGAALLLLDWRLPRRVRPSEHLAVISAAIPLIALMGHLLGVEELYAIPMPVPHAGMALETSVVLLFLASGTLAARPESGVMSIITADDMGGVVGRRLLWSLLILPPVALLLVIGTRSGRVSTPVAVAFLLLFAIAEGISLIVVTSSRLSRLAATIRRRNETLRHNEWQVRALFERASDGIFIADLDGRYTEVNQAGQRMLGWSGTELVGKRIVDIIPPEDVRRLEESKEQMLHGRSHLAEWMLRRKDGTYLPAEVNATILPDGRWQAIVRDITERKAAEDALARAREAEREARIDLERVTAASFTISDALAALPETGLNVALRTFVRQAKTLTKAEYAALGIGGDPEQPFDPWIFEGIGEEEALAIGRPPRPIGTLGIPAKEGRVVRTRDLRQDPSFRGMPAHHPEMRSLLGVPIVFRDRAVGNLYLTNKQGADEFTAVDERNARLLATRIGATIEAARLYEREALQTRWLQALFDSMPESVVIVDETGRVVQQNQAAQRLVLGTENVALFGRRIPHDIRSPSGDPLPAEELPAYRALVHGETVVGKELCMMTPDGRLVPIVASATPIRTDRGPKGVIVVFQDISTLKELEQLREEWAAIVAHDLRQPVAVIATSAELLDRFPRGEDPERDRRVLDRIRTASLRLTRMINDILDASRIEANRLSLDRTRADVSTLIDQVVERLEETTAGRSIQVTVEPSLDASIDVGRIEQVIENLLTNAVKYGTPGTPITIDAFERDEMLEVVVTNHGPGISADQMSLLFERFARTREARSGGASGIGLGLYICKGLVEAHGGRIWAESVPGETSSFHFTLPSGHRAAEARSSDIESGRHQAPPHH